MPHERAKTGRFKTFIQSLIGSSATTNYAVTALLKAITSLQLTLNKLPKTESQLRFYTSVQAACNIMRGDEQTHNEHFMRHHKLCNTDKLHKRSWRSWYKYTSFLLQVFSGHGAFGNLSRNAQHV